jgi:predicted RNA-binding Zn ribbon-like protein
MTPTARGTTEPRREQDQFLRFVNTLTFDHGHPTEHLADMPAVLAWLREERLLSDRVASMERARLGHDPEESSRRLDRFLHLRDVIRAASEEQAATGSISSELVRDLNHILRHGLHYHQLEAGPDHARYGLAKVGDHLDQARATIAGTFAAFLAEDHPERLRVCANGGCREIFVDRSPTGRRRWCDMRTCGNQAKVAAHRQRHRSHENEGLPAPAPAG